MQLGSTRTDKSR